MPAPTRKTGGWWRAGPRLAEAVLGAGIWGLLSRPVEVRVVTLLVFFVTSVMVAFLLAAALVLPGRESPHFRGLAWPLPARSSSEAEARPVGEAEAGADVEVGAEGTEGAKTRSAAGAAAAETLAAQAVSKLRRQRSPLPGKLSYVQPPPRGGAESGSAEAAEVTRRAPPSVPARPRSAPRLGAEGAAAAAAAAAAAPSPEKKYRLLLRSQASAKEAERFHKYFLERMKEGVYREPHRGATGETVLYRVYFETGFDTLAQADQVRQQVVRVAREQPFLPGHRYFEDAQVVNR